MVVRSVARRAVDRSAVAGSVFVGSAAVAVGPVASAAGSDGVDEATAVGVDDDEAVDGVDDDEVVVQPARRPVPRRALVERSCRRVGFMASGASRRT
jgi:hypothetical protein